VELDWNLQLHSPTGRARPQPKPAASSNEISLRPKFWTGRVLKTLPWLSPCLRDAGSNRAGGQLRTGRLVFDHVLFHRSRQCRRWSVPAKQLTEAFAQPLYGEIALDISLNSQTDAPVSSDTMTATASVSSVTRCRRDAVSHLGGEHRVHRHGRKHAAAATRSRCTITAPSCSGALGRNRVASRS